VNNCAGKPDGTACNDGDACTIGEACQAGACTGGTPKTCTHQCYPDGVGTCNPADGTCSFPPNNFKPNYTPCSDDDACTSGDFCYLGTCFAGQICPPANECFDTGTCNAGACSPGQIWVGNSCTKANGASGTCDSSGSCI